MSLKWDDKTLSAFYENTKKAILMLNGKVGTLEQQNKTTFEVRDESIRGIVEQYVGDGDETLKKKMAVFQETADGISAIVTRMEKSAIVSVKQRYYLSESHESLIGGEWQDTQPEWVDGKYIWVMSVITQANGEVTYDGAVCITGNTGQSGVGDGVESYTAYYKLGSSAAAKPEAPSTSWAATPPEVKDDTYLWVAYLVTYTSGKTEWTEPYCATDAIARGEIKEVRSEITQLADSIKLEVTDGSSSGTASIKLSVNGETYTGTIDMSGIVLFKSFLNSTQTKIDGGVIDTDTLFIRQLLAQDGATFVRMDGNELVMYSSRDTENPVDKLRIGFMTGAAPDGSGQVDYPYVQLGNDGSEGGRALIKKFWDGVFVGNGYAKDASGKFTAESNYAGIFIDTTTGATYVVGDGTMKNIYTGDAIARFG